MCVHFTRAVSLSVPIVFFLGCGNEAPQESGIQVSPSRIDFGTIASTGQLVHGDLKISNRSPMKTNVSVVGSCSCMVAEPKQFILLPGDRRDVSFTISANGRKGNFHAEIIVQSSEDSYRVPVAARFDDGIKVFPSRVLLRYKDNTLSGSFKVMARDEILADLIFELAGDGRLGVSSQESGVKIVTVEFDDEFTSFPPVVLKRKGQVASVLSVPVLNSLPKGGAQ